MLKADARADGLMDSEIDAELAPLQYRASSLTPVRLLARLKAGSVPEQRVAWVLTHATGGTEIVG